MKEFNLDESEIKFSELVELTANGESFIITKSGKPIATLTPYTSSSDQAGRIGFLRGKIEVPDDFDSMGQEEIDRMFGGK
jgi:prevent-host-death family protein